MVEQEGISHCGDPLDRVQLGGGGTSGPGCERARSGVEREHGSQEADLRGGCWTIFS